MNDDFLEKLSALVDGELNDFEVRQFLRQLDQAPEEERVAVYQRWQRMQLASSVVQSTFKQATAASSIRDGALSGKPVQSFVSAVSEAIGNDAPDDVALDDADKKDETAESSVVFQALHSVGEEATAVQPTTQVTAIESQSKAEQTPFWSRFALAASVALAVVVGVQQYQMGVQQERILAAGSNLQQLDQTQVALLAELESAQSEEEQIAAQQRLMDHLQERKSKLLGSDAADPYARVATFADEEDN